MRLEELVKTWYDCLDSPESAELVSEKMAILARKIRERLAPDTRTRVFVVSRTECVISRWNVQSFIDHYLDVHEMEGV